MAGLFAVTNTRAKTYNFHCVGCGQLIASEAWDEERGARCWDVLANGQPNWESQHECSPTGD